LSAIDHLLSEACTIQNQSSTGTGFYGGPVVGPSGSPVNATGYLEQQVTVELLVDRYTTVTRWIGYFPLGTVIGRLDFVTFNSQKFQVMGEPENCYNPRTRVVSHIRCDLTVVNG